MKTKCILGLILIAVLPLIGSALTVSTAYSNSTSDNDGTANVALWGQNGTMTGDSFADNFDEYSTTAIRDGDGLFIPATVTLNAVPEPASLMMIGCGAGLIALKRRFFSR